MYTRSKAIANDRHRRKVFALALASVPVVIGGGLLVGGVPAHASVPSEAGTIVAWGDDSYGQTEIPAGLDGNVVSIAAEGDHALALTTAGRVVVWGSSRYDPVPAGVQSGVTAIATGSHHSLAVKSDGSVIEWGGDGTIPTPANAVGITQIAVGDTQSLALRADGTVVSWDFTRSGVTIPAEVQSGVAQITSTNNDNVVLKTDGSVWDWEIGNDMRQLAPADSGIVRITGGSGDHLLAVTASGGVNGWLLKPWGPSTDEVQSVIPPAAQSQTSAVSTGADKYLALTTGGSVFGWDASGSTLSVPSVLASGVLAISQGASTGYALVRNVAPSFTAFAPPMEAPLGQPYSYAFAATGRPAPTYAVADGALPTGLSIDSTTGRLSGTATQTGGFRFKVSASNGYGDPAVTGWLGLSILQAPVFSTPTTAGAATIGSAFSATSAATGYPAPTYAISGGALPSGLTLNATTGAVTGTPALAGDYHYTVRATNVSGNSDQAASLTIAPSTTGQLAYSAPPTSVQPGAWESDTAARMFGERSNIVLSAPVTVAGKTIPAGTKVNSYYVHADPVGNANIAHLFTGSASFGDKILAVATTTADLQATTPLLGSPAVTYSTSADQGLEYDDTASTGSTVGKVNLALNAYNTSDAVRIITLAP
jgi:hypothetical protein